MSSEEAASVFDVAVIGAGWYGLAAAKNYLKLEPTARLVIFDGDDSVGGVWSKRRIYPNLVAQVQHGYFNYPGTPMPKDGATDQDLVSGEMIQRYLDKFARDNKLLPRIRFNSWVEKAERCPRGWRLRVNGQLLETAKLIVSTGVTSIPNVPHFKIEEQAMPVIHSRDIAENVPRMTEKNVQSVVVVGAAKSAYDAVYLLCSLGKRVTWVIRPEGAGPMPIMPADIMGMNTITIASTRLMNYMSPSLLNNNADFWSTLKKGDLQIVRDNVRTVRKESVLFESGEELKCDYVISCTGWGDHFSMFSPELKEELGIPLYEQPSAPNSTEKADFWAHHDEDAEKKVNNMLPVLAPGPQFKEWHEKRTQARRRWRLYNRCVPFNTAAAGDRSIVLLGQIHTTQTPTIAEIQSFWAILYMLGEINLPDENTMVKEISEWNMWTRKRYASVGERYPYALFDWIPYLDRLLGDAGLKSRRKGNFVSELFAPYGPHCYGGYLDEYMGKRPSANKKSFGSSSSGSDIAVV
ncbi:MAG: hypothetical protein Q9227_003249 [Pyrenula ochraceoflavens]